MVKGIIELSTGKILVIGLTHNQLVHLKNMAALTVRVDDMEIPMPFRDVVITMKPAREAPTIPPMTPEQAASTCVVVLLKKVVKRALKHQAVGTVCCSSLKDDMTEMLVLSGPGDDQLVAAIHDMTNSIGAVDITSKPAFAPPSLN